MIREFDFNEEEEEEDEDQPLVQRCTKKRALDSPKEAEAEVSAKRTRRATQNFAPSKVGSSAKVATTTTKKKKAAVKVVDADSWPFIDHLVFDMWFLRDHALERVVELLENQGWDKLYLGNCILNKELARQFFSTLTISGEDLSLLAQFSINGLPYQFTHSKLGALLGVSSTGFSDYVNN